MTIVPEDQHPLHAGVMAKLAEIAAGSPQPPPWYAAFARLGPISTDQERLAVYRTVRDAGSVPEEASFFLIAWMLDLITDEQAEDGLRETNERLEAARQKYGLDEDTPADFDDVPAEYRDAMQQTHEAWDALYVATLEEFGEHEMVRLFRENPDEFGERYERGRQFFHGPREEDTEEDEDWLDELLAALSGCVEPESPMGPLGLHYQEDEGFWEISVHPTPVELVGGAHDGAVVHAGFRLDLEQLRGLFESVNVFGWNALSFTDPEGPYVYVEGVIWGREVFLQVLASPPEDEEPGMKLDATRRRPDESREGDTQG